MSGTISAGMSRGGLGKRLFDHLKQTQGPDPHAAERRFMQSCAGCLEESLVRVLVRGKQDRLDAISGRRPADSTQPAVLLVSTARGADASKRNRLHGG